MAEVTVTKVVVPMKKISLAWHSKTILPKNEEMRVQQFFAIQIGAYQNLPMFEGKRMVCVNYIEKEEDLKQDQFKNMFLYEITDTTNEAENMPPPRRRLTNGKLFNY